MKDLTPLKSKNGESEWPYKGKTIIAVPHERCSFCVFTRSNDCPYWHENEYLDCVMEFDLEDGIMYVEKPAES